MLELPKILQDLNAVLDSRIDLSIGTHSSGSRVKVGVVRTVSSGELWTDPCCVDQTMILAFIYNTISVYLLDNKTQSQIFVRCEKYSPDELRHLCTYILNIPNDPIAHITYPDPNIRRFLLNPKARFHSPSTARHLQGNRTQLVLGK